jgi:CheY-like chemotaxis protein
MILEDWKAEGTRILYVEDDDSLRFLGKRVLGHYYTVDTARDGKEALGKLRCAGYDLLVTDHNMPHLTGIELVAQARLAGLKMPILITSAFLDSSQIASGFRDQITRILPKPFIAAELLEAVARVLNRKAATKAAA